MESETNLVGNTISFISPSGHEIVIREQNGEDDDIISKLKNNNDGTSINRFIASITLSIDGLKPSYSDVTKWKNRDKYYTLLKSRIFSLGEELIFKHSCQNTECNKETTYEENLSLYDRDFSKSTSETNTGFKYQVMPYENGKALEREITLTSGKQIKYKYLNGFSEKKLLELDKTEVTKNTELLVREIQWFFQEKWRPLQNFRELTARDMKEIRSDLSKYDLPFDAVSECKCGFCEKINHISLMAQPDFFFPQGT